MTGAQMRYYNLNAGYKANFALKVRLALSIVHNYENGNSQNHSHSEYKDCLAFIESLEPQGQTTRQYVEGGITLLLHNCFIFCKKLKVF